jgi:hypothetical protein
MKRLETGCQFPCSDARRVPDEVAPDAGGELLVIKYELAPKRETAAQSATGSFRALGNGWDPSTGNDD